MVGSLPTSVLTLGASSLKRFDCSDSVETLGEGDDVLFFLQARSAIPSKATNETERRRLPTCISILTLVALEPTVAQNEA
ncbi:MAG: hypothetical protein R3B13_18710 [Polyangiaceae bacterium]